MNAAFLAVSIFGLLTYSAFLVAYHVKTRGAWWRHEAGRWLMLGRANVAALFGFVVANRAFEHWPGDPHSRQVTLLVLYSLFALQSLWLFRLLWRPEVLTPPAKEENRDSGS